MIILPICGHQQPLSRTIENHFSFIFSMTDVDSMKPMVVAALEFHGGMATLIEVAKYIWEHYQNDLEDAEICIIDGNM